VGDGGGTVGGGGAGCDVSPCTGPGEGDGQGVPNGDFNQPEGVGLCVSTAETKIGFVPYDGSRWVPENPDNPLGNFKAFVLNLPIIVGNAVKWVWNTVDYAVMPGDCLLSNLAGFSSTLQTHAPFSWFAGGIAAIESSLSYTGAPALSGTLTFGSQSVGVNPVGMIAALEPTLAPYRPIMVALVGIGFIFRLLGAAESFLSPDGPRKPIYPNLTAIFRKGDDE
jgi:hypothetical protein